MSSESTNQAAPELLLRQLLLEYLQESRVVDWPGADGLTEDDVLNYYSQASAMGDVPGCQELCRRHTEFVAEIQEFFRVQMKAVSADRS